ncbi:hypothetical protein LHYA1_G004891 [Lachnellula hyalina]|uniref:Glycoside hydrolase 131 catalytic N-terminal domain-containing protein n=1 Tax=Lachnellula hyalina TaxID=1316788 RepID=A0A8H8R551_9HELO|nr:uncharacterized protein LHYA1_G004891 [Lachnellula hyalina]TVY27690.1 hypothetical protein LHYA1_G004891 [Lachnellula hyalina]
MLFFVESVRIVFLNFRHALISALLTLVMASFQISYLASILAFIVHTAASLPSHIATTCPITIDGRVSRNATIQTFDTAASPFNPTYTKGQNLTWSQIIKLPAIRPSKFDLPVHAKALEVTINDSSIFVPGGGSQQVGFRRAASSWAMARMLPMWA